jgi:hypothetical protein
MLRPLLAVASLTMLTATAAAEPSEPNREDDGVLTSNGYIVAAGGLGLQRSVQGGVQLEAGKHIAGTHRFVRGQITAGTSGRDGNFQQVRIGYEHRGCVAHDTLCAFAGLDAGYQHDHVDTRQVMWDGSGSTDDSVVNAHDLIFVPRVGVELGRSVRTRVAVELPFYRRLDSHMDADHSDGGMGLALSFGVGYAF